MTTIWVIERRVRRKGARWQVFIASNNYEKLSSGNAQQLCDIYARVHRDCDFRIAKYRRAT